MADEPAEAVGDGREFFEGILWVMVYLINLSIVNICILGFYASCILLPTTSI